MIKRKLIGVSLAIALFSVSSCSQDKMQAEKNYAELVNPFIGTDFTGNTYPGASAPFGMVQLSPDNGRGGWDRIAGYFYPDTTIAGFSHTHLTGTGAGDLYDILFMPVTNPYKQAKSELGVYSTFSHAQESAHAGYYQVYLQDYDINVELTATARCGVQQYTFPEANSSVFVNLKKAMNWDRTEDSFIEVVDSVTIRGYRFSKGWADNQKLFFVTQFSRPFESHDLKIDDLKTGKAYVAKFDFTTKKGETVVVKTALSAVDYEGAMANLKQEASHNDFAKYKADAESAWNKELNKIQATFEDKNDEVVFYTGLYHTMLAPTLYSDVDGRYRGADQQIHHAKGWDNYSTFSLWDTYRAAHPLYTIMHPERVNDMTQSLYAFGKQNGRLPVWNFAACETDMMIGYHSAVVLAEAYLKGITSLSGDSILDLCVQTANIDSYRGLGDYKTLGYVPYDKEAESLSKTIEYAYDDYTIAKLAKAIGKDSIAAVFDARAKNYLNLYNAEARFFLPKDAKGKWIGNFNPEEYTEHITESNAWQYFWGAQHNLPVYVELLGGKKELESKLDSMFQVTSAAEDLPIFSTGMIGQYAQGNEPSHHVAYIYNYTDSPWKAQELTHKIMKELYRNTPDGLCGNEDCGQMSAWYVFNTLGFYPVDPVSGVYELTSPLVDRADITLKGNKKLSVRTSRQSPNSIYIDKVFWNNSPVNDYKVSHEALMQGGELRFELTDTPKQ
ncbi:MAG: GH92 family glycosyl hydrolase [Bacteroidales bacterium]